MEELMIIKKNIEFIIDKFYKNDIELLEFENEYDFISERCISFRLGIYFQEVFIEYNVDCEYNREMYDIKRMNEKRIYPDIIVHKRKTLNNLIWVEVKKENSCKEKINEDREILKKVTCNKYKYGILIIISSSKDRVKIEYYRNGQKI